MIPGSLNTMMMGGGDPHWDSVSSLLHFDGADASTTFTDETGKTWTANGDAQIDTAQSKFGGSSGLFDGTGDDITTATSTDFDFGTGDFTIEWFEYPTSNVNQGRFHIADTAVSGSPLVTGVAVAHDSSDWYVYHGGTSTNVATVAQTLNVWTHIALVRVSGVLKLFRGGTQIGSNISYAPTLPNTTNKILTIGGYYTSSYLWNGNIEEFRITKGVARYTATFTPPTQAFFWY